MQRRKLPSTQAFQEWQAGTTSHAEARLCLRYALAFNQLDAAWLHDALSEDVTYGSQLVFDEMRGRSAVFGYLRDKLATLLRDPQAKVCAELARLSTPIHKARRFRTLGWSNSAL